MQFNASRDILLQTPHLQQATDFYHDVMGMRIFLSVPGMVGLDAGTFRLFLEDSDPLGPVLEFLAGDFATARRELLDQGCTIVLEDPSIPRCYLRDPFGLVFNLAPSLVPQREETAEEIRPPEPPPHY